MTSKLTLYNGALTECGAPTILALTEEVEGRRLCDQKWVADNGMQAVLEAAQWNFAMRTVQLDHDPDFAPPFGYAYGFVKPTDWVLTSACCSDEYLNVPLTQYTDEGGVIYSDMDPIYLRFVSNDPSYGGNIETWPNTFYDFAVLWLAHKIAPRLIKDEEEVDRIGKRKERALIEAKNRTAMQEPTKFPARGTWSLARQRQLGFRDSDGGATNGNLVG